MTDERLEELRQMRLRSEAELAHQRMEANRADLEELVAEIDDLGMCPRCRSLADVERSYVTSVVYCRVCHFEGARSPLSILVEKLRGGLR